MVANGVFVFALLLYSGYHFFSRELNAIRFDVEWKSISSEDESDGMKERAIPQSLEYRKIESIAESKIRIHPVVMQHPDIFPSGLPESFFTELKDYARDCFTQNDKVNPVTSSNVNLIFLRMNYMVIRTLLNRKPFIHSAASPVAEIVFNTLNPGISNIVYFINFRDSNDNGKLDEFDKSDLYV